jgi:hypothetical protein
MKARLQLIAALLFAAIVGAGAVWYISKPGEPPASPAVAAPPAPIPVHPALPRMQVIAQFGGPLQDTLIQRLRDPIDGTTCYVYLPIAVHHAPPNPATGYVEYGANTVGSISCFATPQARTPPASSGH